MNVPLLIPSFNQLTFLRNLVNWYQYYRPGDDIWILDQASDHAPLLEWYDTVHGKHGVHVVRFKENRAKLNLKTFIGEHKAEYPYYIISDPDIMPHPAVPRTFVDAFRHLIDEKGFHHVGFCLRISDLPVWLPDSTRDGIMKMESQYWHSNGWVTAGHWCNPVAVSWEGRDYTGYRTPIDTTFAMYRSSEGWESPMRDEWWNNALRVFDAFHLGWYMDPNDCGAEMDHYYRSCKRRTEKGIVTETTVEPDSAGVDILLNTHRPARYQGTRAT